MVGAGMAYAHRPQRIRSQAAAVLTALTLAAGWQGVAGPAGAWAHAPGPQKLSQAHSRTIHFHGRAVRVPPGWPVYWLARRPRTCVLLDRRAVYLGTPSVRQRCPAHAIGRRRAIVVDPAATGSASARASRVPSSASPAHIAAASEFTGLGFDACTAPSSRSMAAWAASPYRAVGVYIGGANRACSQPSLTSSWVGEQVAAGWHLIPTYVGLQAPTSSCGSCAKLSSSAAAAQGFEAAADAVSRASAVGIGPGSPIYFDMEAYTRGPSASNATLTFLASWTSRLHALGYVSGVYSSSSSGIADLASQAGTGYSEPDDIWIANWNGQQSTSDPTVPAGSWSRHQRLHQYRGGHNETYGGVTINIDNNYVEGATVGASTSSNDPKGGLESVSSPRPGHVRIVGWAFDPNAPTEPVSIVASVGGRAGEPGAARYELGPVATQPRPDVAEAHTAAGSDHGFDTSFATVKNGRQRVCVYAIDIEPGSDSLLGCRTIGVPVAITLSHIRTTRSSVRARIRCEWPAGTRCPGQILLRAAVRVRVPGGRRRAPQTRVVQKAIARRSFMLSGETSHAFRVSLSSRARRLTGARPALWAQLVVGIPGGHVTHAVVLGPRPRP